jgi:glycosyltransferase involved in cell wall biosynthesis
LVNAIAKIKESGQPVSLVVAGRLDLNNPDAVPQASLRDWAAAGLIEWVGFVDDVTSLLQGVRAAVLPSHSEGLPRSLLEAAAAGRPIVATDIAGCRLVVRPGENGVLVGVGDTEGLATAISGLLRDYERCRRYGDRSRLIAAEFSDANVIDRTLDVYARVLAGQHSTANHEDPRE